MDVAQVCAHRYTKKRRQGKVCTTRWRKQIHLESSSKKGGSAGDHMQIKFHIQYRKHIGGSLRISRKNFCSTTEERL
jgi:hypothetical protein